MSKTRFPKVVAAVRQVEATDLWAIGDALNEELGLPPERGGDRRSDDFKGAPSASETAKYTDRANDCAMELQGRGFEFTAERLKVIARTAHRFSSSARERLSEISVRAAHARIDDGS